MESPLAFITLVVIAGMAAVYAVSGTVAITRTSQLSKGQKVAQSIFLWALPFVGPILVMHLLADRDAPSIPAGWSKNEEINSYVWQALTGHARLAYKSAVLYVETQVVEAIGDALSDGPDAPGGSGEAGGSD
jgi:hypothetical protein